MCNLYRMTKPVGEVARWFDAVDAVGGSNFGDEVYPGYPGLVVAEGKVRQMTWGFPLQRTGARGQHLKPKPVNNCRSDKIDTSFWRQSFAERRCLVPMTAWAEAEGERGAMTCSWLSQPHGKLFAAAGVWRTSAEWGDVFSMVMTDASEAARAVHSRMPVVLDPEDYRPWLSGELNEARALCRPWHGELLIVRTARKWGKAKEPSAGVQADLLAGLG